MCLRTFFAVKACPVLYNLEKSELRCVTRSYWVQVMAEAMQTSHGTSVSFRSGHEDKTTCAATTHTQTQTHRQAGRQTVGQTHSNTERFTMGGTEREHTRDALEGKQTDKENASDRRAGRQLVRAAPASGSAKALNSAHMDALPAPTPLPPIQ